jgi:organic anion transporter 4A
MESLQSLNSSFTDIKANATANIGVCPAEYCDLFLGLFMLGVGVLIFLLLLLDAPYFFATLRVVGEDQRHLALGVQSFIYRVFGSIPGYLLFGVLFDVSCVNWKFECGEPANCLIYDSNALSLNIFSLTIPAVTITLALFFLHWVLYPKRKEDAEEKKDDNDPVKQDPENGEAVVAAVNKCSDLEETETASNL